LEAASTKSCPPDPTIGTPCRHAGQTCPYPGRCSVGTGPFITCGGTKHGGTWLNPFCLAP
jgi:hypothetical protein